MPPASRWELSYYAAVLQWKDRRYTFDPDKTRHELQTLHDAGVRWIGIDGINLMEPFDCDLSACATRIGEWLEEFGFSVSSFHFAGPTFAPLDQGQEKVRANFLENLQVFNVWRPKNMVVHAGWIQSDQPNTTAILQECYEQELHRHGEEAISQALVENIRWWGKAAQEYGMRIALENMGKFTPFGGLDSLPKIISAINEPNVGYCVDSGHAHCWGESPTEWVRTAGSALFETHFHDNRGSKDEHLSPGFGTVDWLGLIQALEEVQFPGPVTFETRGWPSDDIVQGYIQAIAWWNTCERIALSKAATKH